MKSNEMLSMFKERNKLWETENMTSLSFTLVERPGILNDALSVFTKNNVNMTRIQSKPSKFNTGEKRKVEFFIDITGKLTDKPVVTAISQLYQFAERVTEVGTPEVPWFPTRIEDFDDIGNKLLAEGEGI
jgi:prephenate dehydratase